MLLFGVLRETVHDNGEAWYRSYEPEGRVVAAVMQHRKLSAGVQFAFYSVQDNGPEDGVLECLSMMILSPVRLTTQIAYYINNFGFPFSLLIQN